MLTVQGALLEQQLMWAWGGCGVRPDICRPGAGGHLPFNALDHQQCVKPGQGESFKQGYTHTSKATAKAVGLTALGFAHLVARIFSMIVFPPTLHL